MSLLRLLKRQPSLPPLPEGHRDYWVSLHVKLDRSERAQIDDPFQASGYYRVLGLRVAPLELHQLLHEVASDGDIDWTDSVTKPLEACRLPFGVCRRAKSVAGDPVWYRGGCIFYGSE